MTYSFHLVTVCVYNPAVPEVKQTVMSICDCCMKTATSQSGLVFSYLIPNMSDRTYSVWRQCPNNAAHGT